MSEKEKTFFTADEVIEHLREMVGDETLHPAKMAISVGELRNLLDRVKTKDFGQANVKAAIIAILKTYAENNEDGDGLPMPFIWRRLREREARVSNIMVESALTSLLEENAIHTKREGVTYYRYGKDPELIEAGGETETITNG